LMILFNFPGYIACRLYRWSRTVSFRAKSRKTWPTLCRPQWAKCPRSPKLCDSLRDDAFMEEEREHVARSTRHVAAYCPVRLCSAKRLWL